jgi:hypothetical protein
MWNKLSIEDKMETALIDQFGASTGRKYYTQYETARDYLIDQVFPQIRGKEPSLTEHDATHIQNVLTNAEHLLGDSRAFRGIDLYCLGLVILFHDVGNIAGRKGHHHYNRIATVYNQVRSLQPKYNHERNVVLTAAAAHSGISKNGSADTLGEVPVHENIDGHRVQLRDVAAILRFADELAEGPQRTSHFMQTQHGYDKKSMIFHEYANITNVFIDPLNERIALTYEINVERKGKILSKKQENTLKELLSFAYKRIIKLDQERKYTKHYCNILLPFKRTSVKFNISINHELQDLDLNEISLTDITVPGDECKDISQLNGAYEIDRILNVLKTIKA